jgi:hypothetical protein
MPGCCPFVPETEPVGCEGADGPDDTGPDTGDPAPGPDAPDPPPDFCAHDGPASKSASNTAIGNREDFWVIVCLSGKAIGLVPRAYAYLGMEDSGLRKRD